MIFSSKVTGFLLVLLGFWFTRCDRASETKSDTKKLNGLQKFYYPDGQLYLEGTYVDSVANGKFIQYFKNGKVYEEAFYVQGTLHGILKRYHEDGTLSTEIPYDSGRVHGVKKKYRKDGSIAFEAPYHYDQPCLGLKEYYTSGNPVIDWPKIIIEEEDRVWSDNRYSLKLSMSKPGKVEFFLGQLVDGKYIDVDAEKVYKKGHTFQIDYFVPQGGVIMTRINVLAKYKTDLDNFYITQRAYNVGIENPFH